MQRYKLIINNFANKIKQGTEDYLEDPEYSSLIFTKTYLHLIGFENYNIDFDLYKKETKELIFTFSVKFIISDKKFDVLTKQINKTTIKSKFISTIECIFNFSTDLEQQERLLNTILKELFYKLKEARYLAKV